MTSQSLTSEDKLYLLTLARKAIEQAIDHKPPSDIKLSTLSKELRSTGATFVTLTLNGDLRGCIGTLEAYQPLALDVREHAVAAALEDYRFQPVIARELPLIKIEISRLTEPVPITYSEAESLIRILRPGVNGVILKDGFRRATFLPQVWEQLSRPDDFLSHLCTKMGLNPDTWRKKHLDVAIYQVEEFHD